MAPKAFDRRRRKVRDWGTGAHAAILRPAKTLRDDPNDVIWLQDPRQLHYTRGYKWSGQVFRDHFAAARRYRQIVTFGVSLGGLPALRAGRLLKATRAISAGGRLVEADLSEKRGHSRHSIRSALVHLQVDGTRRRLLATQRGESF